MKTKETLTLISNESSQIERAAESNEAELFNPAAVELGRQAVLHSIDAHIDAEENPLKYVKRESYRGPQAFKNAEAAAAFRAERIARHPEKLAPLKLAREAIEDPHAEKLPVSFRGETEPTPITVYQIPHLELLSDEERHSA